MLIGYCEELKFNILPGPQQTCKAGQAPIFLLSLQTKRVEFVGPSRQHSEFQTFNVAPRVWFTHQCANVAKYNYSPSLNCPGPTASTNGTNEAKGCFQKQSG